MKMRFLRFAVLMVAFFSACAVNGGTFSRFTGFGSLENAEDLYGAATSTALSVTVEHTNNDGQEFRKTRIFSVSRSTLAAMEIVFREKLRLVAQDILTNAAVNRDGAFRAVAYTMQPLGATKTVSNLSHPSSEYYLERLEDGSYRLPSFDDKCLRLLPWMVYAIPGLEWARIDLYEKGEFGSRRLIYSLDSRFGAQEDGTYNRIFLEYGLLQIATELAVLGTNSTTELKVSISVRSGSTHSFRVFDPLGYEIVGGTPVKLLTTIRDDGYMRLDIAGGDTGRVLQLQHAESVAGPWTNVGQELMIGVEGYPPLYFLKSLSSGAGTLRVYRLVTVSRSPDPTFTQTTFRLD